MEKTNLFIRTLPSDSLSVVKSSATAVFIPNQLFSVTHDNLSLHARVLHFIKLWKCFIIGLLLVVMGGGNIKGANRYSVTTGNWDKISGNNLYQMSEKLLIYDMLGRCLKAASCGPNTVSTAQLETVSAVYIINAVTDNARGTNKIIFLK